MCHQPDKVNILSHSHPCYKLRTGGHPVTPYHTVAVLPPPSTDTLRPAPTPVWTTVATTTTTTTTSHASPHQRADA
ncbi:hypothetical protein SprV_0401607600 [Sparganum proliferum]